MCRWPSAAMVKMKDEDAGRWMKNGFAARVFIEKDALGCGLRQKAIMFSPFPCCFISFPLLRVA